MTDALDAIFAPAGAANRILGSWLAGTERFLALAEATSTGIASALAGDRSRSVPSLAAATGLDREETARRCADLAAHGILERAGRRVRLAPDLQRLTAPDAVQDLKDVVGTQLARLAALAGCVLTVRPYPTLSEADHLAVARNAGAITPPLLTAAARVLDGIEPLRAAWWRPARHVELGCGAGCQLLSPLLLHPGLSAVGVELSAAVADEARRRARVLGVADRVEIRVGDAGDLPEVASFDTAYWSQPFFPTPARAPSLGAALRALIPGGVFVAPVLVEPPTAPSSAGARAWSIELLVFGAWAIPVLSPPALCEEIRAAGFVDAVVVEAPAMPTRPASVLAVGHYVVARKPSTGSTGLSGPIAGGTPARPGDPGPASVAAYVAARTRLTTWIAGAEALALLGAALSSGVLAAVIEAGTVHGAADRVSIDAGRVGLIAAALSAHGLLDGDESHYRLAAEFDALATPSMRGALGSLLDPVTVRLESP